MAKIIYKKGFEGQNKLDCIEGIEIEMMNGQNALIYPKYEELRLLNYSRIGDWDAKTLAMLQALKVENCTETMDELLEIESPAANYTRQFKSDVYGAFNIPTLFVATEIEYHSKEINDVAKTIEGADLINEYYASIWSCIRCGWDYGWVVSTYYGIVCRNNLSCPCTCVPTLVYKKRRMRKVSSWMTDASVPTVVNKKPQTVYMVTSERAEKKDLNGLMNETKLFANFEDAKAYAKCKFEEVLKFFSVTKDAVKVEEKEKKKGYTEEVYFIYSNFRHHGTEWYVWVSIQKKEIE
mgnify:FL=1